MPEFTCKYIINFTAAFFVLILAERILYQFFLLPEPVFGNDSFSYIAASKDLGMKLLNGQPDAQRTPFYPAVIAVCRECFGEQNAFTAVVYLQRFISFICVVLFFSTFSELLRNRFIAFLAVFYFACSPNILSYNNSILTESLSVSFIVILFWMLTFYRKNPGIFTAAVIGCSLFYAVMLRPFFVFLLPVLFLFFTARFFSYRKYRFADAAGLAAVCCSLLMTLGYSHIFCRNYGIYNMSVIPYLNQFHIIIQSGIYQNGTVPEVNNLIQQNIDDYNSEHTGLPPGQSSVFPAGLSEEAFNYAAWDKSGSYFAEPAAMAKYTSTTLAENKLQYAVYSFWKIAGKFPERFYQTVTPAEGSLHPCNRLFNAVFGFPIRFGFVYLLLTINLIYQIYIWIKRKQCADNNSVWQIIWLTTAGVFFTALVGAPGDWSRLVLPAFPLVIILLCKNIEYFLYSCRSRFI